MDGSDDVSNDDIWSPSLREELFSDYHTGRFWDNDARHHVENLPPPRPTPSFANSPGRPTLIQRQQQRLHNTEHPNSPSVINFNGSAPLDRKHSHLDLPNFPLATGPTGIPCNSSGRPAPATLTHQPPHNPTPPPPTRNTVAIHLPSPPPFDSSPSSPELTDFYSEGSDSPWPSSEAGTSSGFVDLTQDSSPPSMAPARRNQTPLHSGGPQRKHNMRGSLSDHLSEGSSNPAKRRKTGTEASQSSQRSHKIEEVDLRDVDDDRGLSKVLEQQRMATIQAQQEQASKPVKLSTLQCIICMENMRDVTATHCGKLWSA